MAHSFVSFLFLILILLISSSAKRNPECQCKSRCSALEKRVNLVIDCLQFCGFAIIPDVYPIPVLDQIRIAFFDNFTEEQRFEFMDHSDNTLSGKRIEHAMPHWIDSIDGFEDIIYQPLIVNSALNFMVEDGHKLPIFDTMTLITAPPGDVDVHQEWHGDGNGGVKLQIPLVDLSVAKRGPIQMKALEGMDIDDIKAVFKRNCQIEGSVKMGSAILYQQNLPHRGSKNRYPEPRPVIDTSFLSMREHVRQGVLSQFI